MMTSLCKQCIRPAFREMEERLFYCAECDYYFSLVEKEDFAMMKAIDKHINRLSQQEIYFLEARARAVPRHHLLRTEYITFVET